MNSTHATDLHLHDLAQEPSEQPYGIRDCSFRDPSGNLLRIRELR